MMGAAKSTEVGIQGPDSSQVLSVTWGLCDFVIPRLCK